MPILSASQGGRTPGEESNAESPKVAAAGARTPPARRRISWQTQVWLVLAAVVVGGVAVKVFGRPYKFFDMWIYHGAMEWWTSGGELYEFIAPTTTLGYTYPPFAALTMLPIAALSTHVAGWINVVVSVVALGVVLAVLLVPIADRCGWPRGLTVAIALPLALALEPSRETLGFGQVNLLLFLLIIGDLVALRLRRDPRPAATARSAASRFWYSGAWAGVGVGLATAIKVTPGLFIVYFLVARQRRAAAVATLTAAGATGVGWLLAPRESLSYFTSMLWQTDRVGAADFTPNQALSGLLARLYDQPERPGLLWLSFAALFLALGLSRAVAAHKEGDELAAFTLVGLTAAVVSPISWTHHLVFVLPAIVVLGDAALRRRAAAQRLGLGGAGFTFAGLRYATMAFAVFVVFLISPVWWVHHRLDRGGSHYDSGLWGLLAENSMILCMLLLLAVMPWRPGAEPAFPPPGLKHRATLLRSLTDRAGAGRNHAGGIRRDHASGATHDHGSGATRDHAGGAGGSAAARRAQAATPSRSAAGTGGAAAGREDGADPGPVRTGP